MPSRSPTPIRLRVLTAGGDSAIGPGKADLLDGIARSGSIAAAAKAMGMSYRRAWGLIQVMNAAFKSPLVAGEHGGRGGGGAELTPAGRRVLRLYRDAEAAAARASRSEVASIRRLLRDPEG